MSITGFLGGTPGGVALRLVFVSFVARGRGNETSVRLAPFQHVPLSKGAL